MFVAHVFTTHFAFGTSIFISDMYEELDNFSVYSNQSRPRANNINRINFTLT